MGDREAVELTVAHRALVPALPARSVRVGGHHICRGSSGLLSAHQVLRMHCSCLVVLFPFVIPEPHFSAVPVYQNVSDISGNLKSVVKGPN